MIITFNLKRNANTDGAMGNCLRQPEQLDNQPPKVYGSKFISTYQILWHADRS
jgi:hypothetical protein